MAKLIRLIEKSNKNVAWYNPAYISRAVRVQEEYTEITFTDRTELRVVETPEEINNWMKE